MAISYNKLWKLLVDKKMSKADLRKATGIAPNTMTRLRRDEEVTLTVLNRICSTLEVDIGDIMEFCRKSPEKWIGHKIYYCCKIRKEACKCGVEIAI